MKNKFQWGVFVLLILLVSCSGEKSTETKTESVVLKPYPSFNADSAYAFVQKQVDFGPRVPGTPGHAATKVWMVEILKKIRLDCSSSGF